MSKWVSLGAILVGLAVLAAPFLVLLLPLIAFLTGSYTTGLSADVRVIALLILLSMTGTALLTSGIWALALRPRK